MECNRDEAVRAKMIAERKLAEEDYIGAKKFVSKALSLYPGIEGISQLTTTLDVYISAENKVSGEVDWYGILGVNPSADDEVVKKQYRKLALTLHPDKNKFIGAEGAFKLISEAWSLLSDKTKRLAYNQRRSLRVPQHHVSAQSRDHQSVPSRASPKPTPKASVPSKPTPKASVTSSAPSKPTPKASVLSSSPPKRTPKASVPSSAPPKPTPKASVPSSAPPKPTPKASVPSSAPPRPTPKASVPSRTPPKPTPKASVPSSVPPKPTPKASVPSSAPSKPTRKASVPSSSPPKPTPKASVPSRAPPKPSPKEPSTANGFHNVKSQNKKSKVIPTGSQQKNDTFWTLCQRCKMQHYKYLKTYLNKTLLCPNCHEPFVALETSPPPNFPKSSNLSSGQKHPSSFNHVAGTAAKAANVVKANETVKRDREEVETAVNSHVSSSVLQDKTPLKKKRKPNSTRNTLMK